MRQRERRNLGNHLAEQLGLVTLHKNVNHLLFEIGALRRELAERGLAKQHARRKDIDLVAIGRRLYSGRPQPRPAKRSTASSTRPTVLFGSHYERRRRPRTSSRRKSSR